MARKRKLQQRVKEIGAAVEQSIREDADTQKLELVTSEELFQIDTKGGKLTKKQKLAKKDPVVKSNKFIADKANKYETELVKKLSQRETAVTKAKPQQRESLLWGSDGVVPVPAKVAALDEYVAPAVVKKVAVLKRVPSTRHKVKKVAIPVPGQSYHPDFDSHQNVLAAAVAQELEKQERRKEHEDPLSKGLSEETLQFIKDGDSEEESEDDNEEAGATKKRRMREKVTTAQKNKRARHHQMEMEHKAKRSEKAIVKQINTANHILQSIVKKEKESKKNQELKKVIAEQKLEEEPMVKVGRQMTKIERDTPVLLSDELSGSLRQLKPKGNPLLDRFDSLHKRNMIVVNHSRAKGKRKVKIIEVKK